MQATEPTRPRARHALPLALRLFLGTALLIAFAVGTAVAVTWVQGRRIAAQAIDKAQSTSAAVQREVAQHRLEQLQLAARLIAIDPGFVKYIADAAGPGSLPGLGGEAAPDTDSMRDLLGERRREFALDLAILLDAEGGVLARTDESEAFQTSLADDALVGAAVRDAAPFSGYWREGDRLYQAAVIPIAQDQDLVGFLLVALAINDEMSRSVAQVSGAQLAFWLPGREGPMLVASSFDAALATELRKDLPAHHAQLLTAMKNAPVPGNQVLHLGGQEWAVRLAPTAAPGAAQLGVVAVLIPVDQVVGSYRAILNWVILAGVASIAIALLLSFLLARRILRPIGVMAQAAESAAAGNYQTRIGEDRDDVLGRLARAFDKLLSDLREKSDIEGYVGHLARFLPEPVAEREASPNAAPAAAPRRDAQALLGIEFRHLLASSTPAPTAPALAQEFARVQMLLADSARTLGAELRRMGGVRWHLAFSGAQRVHDGARGWAVLLRECTQAGIPAPACALADGDVVHARSADAGDGDRLALGTPLAALDRLLCDGAAGRLLLARTAGETLQAVLAPDSLLIVDGGFSGKRYFALTGASIGALTSDAAATVVRPLARPAVAATAGALVAGRMLGGRYRIISELGAGGMGVVYKAHDLELDDVVALKMLRPGALLDVEQLDRLKSEIKLARKITHPNVLRTFDFGDVDGQPYISMEYVRGLTLRYLLGKTERVPCSAALRIARQLSAGLAAAHEVGVLHRDIKPENLILEANGNAKLMDFGIARPVRRAAPGHTQPGTFLGTPNYCAPEQLLGDEVDERGDIYACGVLMSEMFCGGLPFAGGSTLEIYQAQIRNEPLTPSALWPDIPPDIEAVILRCLRFARDERFASARELNESLANLRT